MRPGDARDLDADVGAAAIASSNETSSGKQDDRGASARKSSRFETARRWQLWSASGP
jgi:hypothetical protein